MTEDEFDLFCENLALIRRVRAEVHAESLARYRPMVLRAIQNMMERFHISREEAISLLDFGPEYYADNDTEAATTTTAQ